MTYRIYSVYSKTHNCGIFFRSRTILPFNYKTAFGYVFETWFADTRDMSSSCMSFEMADPLI